MAGGVGSRFWPFSTNNRPKQFLDFFGTGKSLLRMTFERFRDVVPVENVYVVTNAAYKDTVKEQLPELSDNQVLLEPMRRNTAPCIAYATYKIRETNAEANIIVVPSDHLITNETEYVRVVKEGLPVHDVIIQEGVHSLERVDDAVAEPVVYMIDRYVVGGFYRVNERRDINENQILVK